MEPDATLEEHNLLVCSTVVVTVKQIEVHRSRNVLESERFRDVVVVRREGVLFIRTHFPEATTPTA